MRLGVLPLGIPVSVDADWLTELRSRDVDVVIADEAVLNNPGAARESERLARADCDGVILLVDAEPDGAKMAVAAGIFLAGVPLLLWGTGAGFFAAAGALEEIGSVYDRLPPDGLNAARIDTWLRENRKEERQRGREAARRLYGRRLFVPAEFAAPDAAFWTHQFGVLVSDSAEGADFAADDGDAYATLAAYLLSLVVGKDTPVTKLLLSAPPLPAGENEESSTFTQITRCAGRIRCLLFHGTRKEAVQTLRQTASADCVHAVLGNHLGALRTACDSLDMDPVIVRGA